MDKLQSFSLYNILYYWKTEEFSLTSRRIKGFYTLQIVRTCPGTHIASHFICMGVSILGGKTFGMRSWLTDLVPIWK